MKKSLPILILTCILLFSMACVVNRFSRSSTATTNASLPTFTPVNPPTAEVTQPAPASPTKASPSLQPTSTALPSIAGAASPTAVTTPAAIGDGIDCDDLIKIEVVSTPSSSLYLDKLKAQGTWLVVRLQFTNLTGETYNYLHENDLKVVSSNSGQTVQVDSSQQADTEAYFLWAYSSYLVDPLAGGSASQRIAAFDVDPSIKDWTLVFSPKISRYSPTPFCTVEITLK